MTATQKFIEDAIAGGWKEEIKPKFNGKDLWIDYERGGMDSHYTLLLDPLAWQAVGKTRGWNNVHENSKECYHFDCPCHDSGFPWRENWHRFIDNLADGLPTEEALTNIESP